jgi:hypothetical protein
MVDFYIYIGVLIWLGGAWGMMASIGNNSPMGWPGQLLVAVLCFISWPLILVARIVADD